MGNSIYWGKYGGRLAGAVKQLLPESWTVTVSDVDDRHMDAWLTIKAADKVESVLAVEFKTQISPQVADAAWPLLQQFDADGRLLVAPHLSTRTRDYLRRREMYFLDFAGNAYLRLDRPALYINTTGGLPDPKIEATGRRLRGAKAGRLVRYLCDHVPPFTVTELSKQLDIEAGNVSRYLELLQSDGLIVRAPRGALTKVFCEGLLRRWAVDYRRPVEERFVDPRGVEHFFSQLEKASKRYVLSGVSGASFYAPYTAETSVLCYCDNFQEFASSMHLSRSERSSNVVLALPFDEWVYQGARKFREITVASPSQVAVDLLVGHGRDLQQAEELLRWMREHESEWRS